MIKQVNDSKTFLEICDKLDFVKDCKLSKKALYTFIIAGIYSEKTLSFVSHNNKDEMDGCAVINVNNDITGDLTLSLVFLWIDPHNRKLWKDYMKFIEDLAKEYKVIKISFTTMRSEKAIDKHLGKFGYSKVYNVIEKRM